MEKIDKFKKFVSNHPEFIDYIKKNNVSWQTFYELYDLYGEDEKIWNKYISKDIGDSFSISSIINAIKNINLDSLEENVNSIQKIVSLVEELTSNDKKEENTSIKEEKIDKIYGEK